MNSEIKTAEEENIELLSAEVHNSWWEEKKKQGFHAPIDCPHLSDSDTDIGMYKVKKFCDKCHTDMYPYDELPENVKEYDRVTVRTVLKAQKNIQ